MGKIPGDFGIAAADAVLDARRGIDHAVENNRELLSYIFSGNAVEDLCTFAIEGNQYVGFVVLVDAHLGFLQAITGQECFAVEQDRLLRDLAVLALSLFIED